MVVCDLFETETATFWKRPGVDPVTINTEVYLLPGASFCEKEGSASNSGRLMQWREKACDPPGDAKDEVDILNDLGAAIQGLYSGSAALKDAPIVNLAWPVGLLITGTSLADKVAKETNGYALVNFDTPVIAGAYASYTAGQQLNTFFHLMSGGETACGNWLFTGTYQKTANARTGNYNQMQNRRNVDDHPSQIGIYRDWGYSWPVNRRIIYNRAAVYQSGGSIGIPLAGTATGNKWVVWWNGTNWDGGCGTGQANDVVDGFGTAGPGTWLPYIMREEGVGRLMGIGTSNCKDGPFPEHWEPYETPLNANILTNGLGPLVSPYVYTYPGRLYADTPLERTQYPIVATTFRLTEHWHGGGCTRNCPTQCEMMPEPFIEISEELAGEKGIGNGELVIVSSIRGSITLKACVTKRLKPYVINGEVVHQVGMPWHWGWAGIAPGNSANVLTPFIGDANTRIPETKVFLVDIAKA
jgi:formate dehydrogenase major subunit